METRAPFVVVGAFVLAAIAAVFGFVYWLHNTAGLGPRTTYHVQFDGSVPGLLVGAAVLFNGIRVGEVTEIGLARDNPRRVNATISVASAAPVRSDTRVGVEFQGLTGVPVIALEGGTAPKAAGAVPTLIAEAGAGQSMTQAARDALRKVQDFIEENQKSFHSALENIEKFSGALARNSDRIDKITEGLQNLSGGADGKSGEINEAARSIRSLADNLDKRTSEITTGINHFTATGAKEIQAVSRDIRATVADIDRTVKNIDRNPSRLFFGGGNSNTNQPSR